MPYSLNSSPTLCNSSRDASLVIRVHQRADRVALWGERLFDLLGYSEVSAIEFITIHDQHGP